MAIELEIDQYDGVRMTGEPVHSQEAHQPFTSTQATRLTPIQLIIYSLKYANSHKMAETRFYPSSG